MKCDGVFSNDMLNDEGNEFAQDYFDFENRLYLDDYEETFPEAEDVYDVKDSWENYEKIKKVIQKRYLDWKNHR